MLDTVYEQFVDEGLSSLCNQDMTLFARKTPVKALLVEVPRQTVWPAARRKTGPPETDRDSVVTQAAASAQEGPEYADVDTSHLLSPAPRSPWLPGYNSCYPLLLLLRLGSLFLKGSRPKHYCMATLYTLMTELEHTS